MTAFEPEAPLVAPSIRRRSADDRQGDPVSFTALRSLGIGWAQEASGRRWTDYNLHDPGVTILEQLCYALTELAYRGDLPVADHLCGPDGSIDFRRQALFPPEAILPCRPTTADDYRRIMLDRIRGLADARFVTDDAAQGGGRLPGLHRLRLRLAAHGEGREPARGADCAAQARAIYRGARTLGEDLAEVSLIASRPCELWLSASITGMRDPADILAKIYSVCAAKVDGVAQARSVAELLADGLALEDIFEGPSATAGRIGEAELSDGVTGRLLVSDLRALVAKVDGVAAVDKLELYMDGRPMGPAPEWPAELWAPRLRVPGDGWDGDDGRVLPGQVSLHRRGMHVSLDAAAVARRRPATQRGADGAHQPLSTLLPPPKGTHRPYSGFRSVQEEFPPIYGLGRRGDTSGGGAHGLSQVEQLKGYLALFDQVLANEGEQLAHIRDLFTPHDLERSYFNQVLTNADVPGIERLYRAAPEVIAAEVYAPFDDAVERRGRALDYQLALYGENYAQNTLRQFLDFLDSREMAEALLQNKATFLRLIESLGRDRAAGVDTSVPLWTPGATTGLHRRICLLLGFKASHARSLTAWFKRWRLGGALESEAAGAVEESASAQGAAGRALAWPPRRRTLGERVAHVRRLYRDRPVAGALLINGVNRERYRWRPDAKGRGGRLFVVDDHGIVRCELGAFSSEPEAAQFADLLRLRELRLNDASEGLHIVEHILLRPRGGGRADARFHGLRVTVVLPRWTARTSRQAFRAFAEETIQINAPAHVAADCLWLDFAEMRRFEALYAAWAGRLRRYEQVVDLGREVGTATRALDAAAARLTGFLREALGRQQPDPSARDS